MGWLLPSGRRRRLAATCGSTRWNLVSTWLWPEGCRGCSPDSAGGASRSEAAGGCTTASTAAARRDRVLRRPGSPVGGGRGPRTLLLKIGRATNEQRRLPPGVSRGSRACWTGPGGAPPCRIPSPRLLTGLCSSLPASRCLPPTNLRSSGRRAKGPTLTCE